MYLSNFPVTLEQDTHEKEKGRVCLNYCVSGLLPSFFLLQRERERKKVGNKIRGVTEAAFSAVRSF